MGPVLHERNQGTHVFSNEANIEIRIMGHAQISDAAKGVPQQPEITEDVSLSQLKELQKLKRATEGLVADGRCANAMDAMGGGRGRSHALACRTCWAIDNLSSGPRSFVPIRGVSYGQSIFDDAAGVRKLACLFLLSKPTQGSAIVHIHPRTTRHLPTPDRSDFSDGCI